MIREGEKGGVRCISSDDGELEMYIIMILSGSVHAEGR